MIAIEQLYELYKKHPVITTDSRTCPKDSLFFALKGENFNGNLFAARALASGCAYAIVDEAEYATNERIILVEDSLKCLQQLAQYHRRQLKGLPVIGITGTNGKTTTKELTAAVLAQKYRVLYTQDNLNNHIGVPLTLLKLTREHDIAIIEMGANHPGEIKTLVNIVQPDYGLITNVGKAHLEGFGSFEGVLHTKGELYDYLREHKGKIFINAQNPYLNSIAKGIGQISYNGLVSGGLRGEILDNNPYLKMCWTDGEKRFEVQTHLIGGYNLENILAAVCVGKYFLVDNDNIRTAINDYIPSNNRSQLKQTPNNTLIIDTYNANPTSMNAALDNFILYKADNKAVILGGMRELGAYSQVEHQKIIDKLLSYHFRKICLIGEEFAGTQKEILHFETAEACHAYLSEQPLKGLTILLKGSRANRLEQLIDVL